MGLALLKMIPVTAWRWMVDRLWNHVQSTKIGLAIIPIVFGAFTVLGCDPNLMMSGVVAVLVGAIKMLGTDHDKVAESLLDAFKSGVQEAKAATVLPAVFMCLLLSGCATSKAPYFCTLATSDEVKVAVTEIMKDVKPGTDKDKAELALQIAAISADAGCTAVKAIEARNAKGTN